MLTGADIAAGPLWMEYIAFLKSLPVRDVSLIVQFALISLPSVVSAFVQFSYKMVLQAQTSLEETQRMTAVRKAYQKAIVTPTNHIEQLWRDYENFENSVSRALVILAPEYPWWMTFFYEYSWTLPIAK